MQRDELWGICYANAKNVPADKAGTFGYGNVWMGAAMDANTKLILPIRPFG